MTEQNGESIEDSSSRPTPPPQWLIKVCPALADQDAFRHVNDVEEETFFLYTLSAPPVDRIGLGQLNDKSDFLDITVDLLNTDKQIVVRQSIEKDKGADSTKSLRSNKRRGTESAAKSSQRQSIKTLCTSIQQSTTSLRSTTGDTGSVVWRSSVYLGAKILQDLSADSPGSSKGVSGFLPILDCTFLQRARVIELGAGTAILSSLVLAHPLFRRQKAQTQDTIQWLATDQENILPLLRKNVEKGNANGTHEAIAVALDWQEASQCYTYGTPSAKKRFTEDLLAHFTRMETASDFGADGADLVIATDCVFNPSLFSALLDTLAICTMPNRTVVMVVCELRQADMMHDFVQAWLEHDQGKWCIYALENKSVLGPYLAQGSVVWIAWRRSE